MINLHLAFCVIYMIIFLSLLPVILFKLHGAIIMNNMNYYQLDDNLFLNEWC